MLHCNLVLRSDTAFNEILCDAREFANELDIPANFELTQPRHRIRRRNVNFDYEARDDPMEDPTLKYKAEFYFFTLDKKLSMHLSPAVALSTIQVTVRFGSIPPQFRGRTLWGWSEASHLPSLPPTSREDLRLDGYLKYPHAAQALYIYKHPCLLRNSNPDPTAQQSASLTTIPDGRQDIAYSPNKCGKWRKEFLQIKKFLRSTTTDDRLNGLTTIAIEHELAEEINMLKKL
ncbi:uncharacterized protein TNCV_3806321 [Trichonephila clavipes]|nr:uncharacterized protein TNCV_3806321 [Trichonephila clavipes]